MNVDVLPGVPATVAHVLTVDDLRLLAAWPPGLVLIVNRHNDFHFNVVRVERAS